MLEDFGQEVDLLGGDEGNRSYFWTKLRYVPLGNSPSFEFDSKLFYFKSSWEETLEIELLLHFQRSILV